MIMSTGRFQKLLKGGAVLLQVHTWMGGKGAGILPTGNISRGAMRRLKLQKRMVYGRANFDLLRLRVLTRT